jgi:ubiquinone biosynthesis protein
VLKEAVYDLNRMRQILQVMVKHGFGDFLQRAKIFERTKIRKPEEKFDGNQVLAQRITAMLTELGPTFIKLGQILSTRSDLLPPEYIRALRELQDHAAPIPFSAVADTIQSEFGHSPHDLFKIIESEPMASASIAQVHRAVTFDGQESAVKVKRPKIEKTVRSDLDILYYLAHLLEAAVEDTSLYNLVGVVREFDCAVGLELDLNREADNLRAFAKNFSTRSNLVIPEPIAALSSRNVLTMKYLQGMHIDSIEPGSELAKKAALNLIEGAYQQVFEDGLFHSDPHPGNLLVLPDGRVGVMDFGQVGKLTTAMRSTLMLLGLGIVLRDSETISRLVYRLGTTQERVDLNLLREEIQSMLEGTLDQELSSIDTGHVLRSLLDLSIRYHVAVPSEYTLVIKALATIESVVRRLHPDLNISEVAAPYVKRLLAERYNLDDMRGGLMRSLFQLSSVLSEVPQQISQILMDMEGGRLTVNVRDPESVKIKRVLNGIGMHVVWGLIAAGLLAGSLPSLLASSSPSLGAYLCLGGAGLIAIATTVRYFVSPLLRKINLRTWLERRWGEDIKKKIKTRDETP